ncbi:MAG: 4Fe-4S binding protein [Nitrososphaeria archaeon]
MKRVAAISFPSKGVAGKTGVWRIRKPILDRQKCVKCLKCWIYCPEGTILRKEDDSIEIDYEYCKGCGVCANECPARAIMMVEE